MVFNFELVLFVNQYSNGNKVLYRGSGSVFLALYRVLDTEVWIMLGRTNRGKCHHTRILWDVLMLTGIKSPQGYLRALVSDGEVLVYSLSRDFGRTALIICVQTKYCHVDCSLFWQVYGAYLCFKEVSSKRMRADCSTHDQHSREAILQHTENVLRVGA